MPIPNFLNLLGVSSASNLIPQDAVFYNSFKTATAIPEIGPAPTSSNIPTLQATVFEGVQCCDFFAGDTLTYILFSLTLSGAYKYSLSFWCAVKGPGVNWSNANFVDIFRDYYSYFGLVRIGSTPMALEIIQNGTSRIRQDIPSDLKMHHYTIMADSPGGWQYVNWNFSFYIDGVLVKSDTFSKENYSYIDLNIGHSRTNQPGMYLASVRVFDRLLTDIEIAALSREHKPTA